MFTLTPVAYLLTRVSNSPLFILSFGNSMAYALRLYLGGLIEMLGISF